MKKFLISISALCAVLAVGVVVFAFVSDDNDSTDNPETYTIDN